MYASCFIVSASEPATQTTLKMVSTWFDSPLVQSSFCGVKKEVVELFYVYKLVERIKAYNIVELVEHQKVIKTRLQCGNPPPNFYSYSRTQTYGFSAL